MPPYAGSVRRCGRPETLKSNMTDAPSPESLATLLQQDLRLLASSAAEQRAWAAAQAVHVPPDEMRLSFLDEVPGLIHVYVENGYVDAEGEAALVGVGVPLEQPYRRRGTPSVDRLGCSRGLAHLGADSSAGSAGIGASPHFSPKPAALPPYAGRVGQSGMIG